MMLMILMALLLVACGGNGEDEDAQPAGQTDDQAVEATLAPTETEVAEEEEEESTPVSAMASPAAGGELATPAGATPDAAASPVSVISGGMASPVADASPVGALSPAAVASPAGMASPQAVAAIEGATPMTMASPVASTPAAANVVVPPASDDASPEASPSPAATTTLKGQIELAGNENQAYVLSENGCVGIGDNADLEAGRQLVVRDESGAIIGVTTLEAGNSDDTCAWTFSVDVPESEFYAVSIPMKMELVFTHADIAESNGEVTIILP
jgi:hypothetical protein